MGMENEYILGSNVPLFLTLKFCKNLTLHVHISLHLHHCRIDVNIAMPQALSAFHMHAVVPVIQCIVNTVGQPQLCHSTLCLLREVSVLAT